MIEDKNKYKKEVHQALLKEYRESKTRLEKKAIKEKLYADPNLTEHKKDEIWSNIIRLEYLREE